METNSECTRLHIQTALPEGEVFLQFVRVRMVLPVRIELTTSALPRMRSTTELRQH